MSYKHHASRSRSKSHHSHRSKSRSRSRSWDRDRSRKKYKEKKHIKKHTIFTFFSYPNEKRYKPYSPPKTFQQNDRFQQKKYNFIS